MSARENLVAVIMAGGIGSRFWPASTPENPKQFLKLFGERSLLQQSYDRIASLIPADRILILTQERFRGLVNTQLPDIPDENIIGEPIRRDTAAPVALSALWTHEKWGQKALAVLTSDHIIGPEADFQKALLSAAEAAMVSDCLYTFGIPPNYPATGFGYLEMADALQENDGIAHFKLKRFVEKPDHKTAQQYCEAGHFLWNSGMFVWRNDVILKEFEKQLPAHLKHLQSACAGGQRLTPKSLTAAFEPLQSISVDFGIMENAADVRCVKAPFSWSDVGGWRALYDHIPPNAQGNLIQETAVFTHEATGNLVFSSQAGEEVGLLGVSDLVVVRSQGQTLIAHKDKVEELKKLLAQRDNS